MCNPNLGKSFSIENKYDIAQLHEAFIQNVSHELRTPVTIIYGYADLLSSGKLGDMTLTQQRAVKAIADNAENLRKMVERLDTLISAHAKSGVAIPVLMTDAVSAAVEAMIEKINDAGLELELDLEPGLPLLEGDPYHLQLAVECLLENSIKFNSKDGKIEIQLYIEGEHVCLAVEDNGIGMDRDEIRQILSNQFYQTDGSLTRKYSGLGLGLTLVKAVVEEHDGLLKVSSARNQGSRFVMKLPIKPFPHNSNRNQWDNRISGRAYDGKTPPSLSKPSNGTVIGNDFIVSCTADKANNEVVRYN